MDCGKKLIDLKRKLSRLHQFIFLLLILTWLGFYIFCSQMTPPAGMDVEVFIATCRAALNVSITSYVIFITYKDRFKHYGFLAFKVHGTGGFPKVPGLFVPLALAVIPFTSAMTDLADATKSYILVMNLSLGMLFIITLFETVIVCFFEGVRWFKTWLWLHLAILIGLAFCITRIVPRYS